MCTTASQRLRSAERGLWSHSHSSIDQTHWLDVKAGHKAYKPFSRLGHHFHIRRDPEEPLKYVIYVLLGLISKTWFMLSSSSSIVLDCKLWSLKEKSRLVLNLQPTHDLRAIDYSRLMQLTRFVLRCKIVGWHWARYQDVTANRLLRFYII